MTRFALAAILGAWLALVAWVLWVLAHAPDDTEPCDLCGEPTVCRVPSAFVPGITVPVGRPCRAHP